ncbi:T9SS type B sorting domain-containing protein [Christiangramia sabulilitoris]|uniref:T9SS type B sorting domain-containing protein n=1 Tax=Christiangramia sabulilitoris TaxID=2583991 RepID=A0A550I316_9FLAO|nr:T9SS type B sorting domain-containing protein [Christiangramia sabulilitoris]TRO65331.1 T9SS type B sorting domain-containing protein [Christiangramia sabulilitoris]
MKKILNVLLILGNLWFGMAQNSANDCSGAIKICGDGAISSNADGVGRQELTGSNNCNSQEHNSLWLEIEITKAGTLGFNLIPTSSDLNIDYDFFIFGPNANCGALGNAIRCSTTNPLASNASTNRTGMNDMESDTSEGPGASGNNFVKALDVLPGETYFIVIDRPIGNSPFKLEWTGTSTLGGFPFPDGPRINKPNDLETCNSNGVSDFDVSSTSSEIVTQDNTTLTYHESLADASDNLNPIRGMYNSNQPVKTIYARVENNMNGCAKITDFDLIINDGPLIKQDNILERCDLDLNGMEEYVLTDLTGTILNGLDPDSHDVKYFQTQNDAINYRNAIESDYPSTGEESVYARVSERENLLCYNIAEIELTLNAPPQIESVGVFQPQVNSNSNTITLQVSNASDYEYSIGNIDGPYQTSTTFKNVNSGFQTVYIRDLKGCAIVSTEIVILGYDSFFTPNFDGINDFWQIKGISSGNNLVHIFDRYGKLLKKLKTTDRGWDGTFNGINLPSDDYWFNVRLQNGQEFNGHFTLVR